MCVMYIYRFRCVCLCPWSVFTPTRSYHHRLGSSTSVRQVSRLLEGRADEGCGEEGEDRGEGEGGRRRRGKGGCGVRCGGFGTSSRLCVRDSWYFRT
jgi:hypothetical protein